MRLMSTQDFRPWSMNEKQPELVFSSSPEGQTPLLSIVTLSYNTGRFVVEGMAAMQPQLTEEVEHVILDDGSSDDSVQLMSEFANSKGYPVRIYVNSRNCGITESKSRILKLAKGQFVAACADDLFLPERVNHDVKMIQSLPENAAGFYSLVLPFTVGAEGERRYHDHPLGKLRGIHERAVMSPNDLIHRLRQGNFIPAMSVCLRKSVYDAYPQDTSYFIEDYPMWAKMARGGWSLVYSPEVTTLYRRAEHSVQKSFPLAVDFDAIRVQLEILKMSLRDFNKPMKERWFRVVCEADEKTIRRLQEVCDRSANSGGILLCFAKMNLSNRSRWIFSNLSLKFNFWRYI